MNVVLGVVLYDAAFRYIEELIDSINRQDTDDFSILFINDDIYEEKLEKRIVNVNKPYSIVHYDKTYSPMELRIKLIEESKKIGADIMVMCDADDILSSDRISRVSTCASINNDYTFFYNDIFDFSGDQMLPTMPDQVDTIKDIIDYNFLGLSNTALYVKKLSDDEIKELHNCKHRVFDWYLFSIILLNKQKGKFVNGARTFYRLHDNNIVGNQNINPNKIDYEVSVKIKHYESLKNKDDIFMERLDKYLKRKYVVDEKSKCVNWWGFTHPK